MAERSVKEVMRVREDTSAEKNKPTDLCLKWLEHEKSEKNRNENVVLTGNSVRQERGDNRDTEAVKAKIVYEKNERLVEKQEMDRYNVSQVVEGGRVMRGIDKEAVRNRYNVKITQEIQRVGDKEAVDFSRHEYDREDTYETESERVGEEAVKHINERH
jgi:hypothetical protein